MKVLGHFAPWNIFRLRVVRNFTSEDTFWSGGIKTFWAQKPRQEKLSKLRKILNYNKCNIYNFLCQNVLIFSIYIIQKNNWKILV